VPGSDDSISGRIDLIAIALILLSSGCATSPKLGMEAPGRPAVTWHSQDGGSTAAEDTQAHTERELLAELHEEEQQGSEDLALATTLYNLAILRRQQDEFAEAGRLYRRALEIRERKQGANHPDVATVLNNLAALEAAQGNYGAAQPLLERALTIRQTALGTEHVLTAESLNNLALLYAAQGNAAAAEPLYQRALSILEKTDGKDTSCSGDLDRVLGNYAALLHDTGRDAAAEKLETRARSIRDGAGREAAP
jgi:tetratricopeptide (TPR) repeat protein